MNKLSQVREEILKEFIAFWYERVMAGGFEYPKGHDINEVKSFLSHALTKQLEVVEEIYLEEKREAEIDKTGWECHCQCCGSCPLCEKNPDLSHFISEVLHPDLKPNPITPEKIQKLEKIARKIRKGEARERKIIKEAMK